MNNHLNRIILVQMIWYFGLSGMEEMSIYDDDYYCRFVTKEYVKLILNQPNSYFTSLKPFPALPSLNMPEELRTLVKEYVLYSTEIDRAIWGEPVDPCVVLDSSRPYELKLALLEIFIEVRDPASEPFNFNEYMPPYYDTLLIRVIIENRPDSVRLLKEFGANLQIGTNDGTSPLYMAARLGRREIVEILLETTPDVHEGDLIGETPLQAAARNGHSEVVELLVKLSDKDAVEDSLLLAAENGHARVVEVLLEAGADTEVTTDDGSTPLGLALQNGHDSVIGVLMQAYTINRDTGAPLLMYVNNNNH